MQSKPLLLVVLAGFFHPVRRTGKMLFVNYLFLNPQFLLENLSEEPSIRSVQDTDAGLVVGEVRLCIAPSRS